MIFCEGGYKAEVEIVEIVRGDEGEAVTFRVLQTLLRGMSDPETLPKDGETFTAYKSHSAESAAGWRLDGI